MFGLRVTVWQVRLVIWTWLFFSVICVRAGDTSNCVFLPKAGKVSTVPWIVQRSLSARTGTMIWWSGFMTVFCVVRNSIIWILYRPLSGFSCRVMSGNLTTLLARSSVTEYFLKNDIPIKMLPMVGRIMKVSSNTLPPMKKRSSTCFRTGTMLPFAIWTLKSGAGYSSRSAAGCADRIRLSSSSDIALLIAPVSRSPWFSYSRNCNGTYNNLSFLFNWSVAVNTWIATRFFRFIVFLVQSVVVVELECSLSSVVCKFTSVGSEGGFTLSLVVSWVVVVLGF